MRLLHTADLHLGKILHEQSLLDDQAQILDQIADHLARETYDLFIIAGDVFDRSVPPPEALVLWDRFLSRLTQDSPTMETVVISGNHDGAVRLSYASGFLDRHRVHVRTEAAALDIPIELTIQGVAWQIFAVPFLQAGSLADSSNDDSLPKLRSQRDLWRRALDRIEAVRDPGKHSILVAHLFTAGGEESDSERIFVGEAEQVPASWFSGWDYAALGHLHRPQEPAPGVVYSGSPLAYSFSEAGQEKHLCGWSGGKPVSIPLTPLRPLTRLKGTFEQFARSDFGQEARDHWVELTLTDTALVTGALEWLRPRFPRLLSLIQQPQVSSSALAGVSARRTGDLQSEVASFLNDVGSDLPEALLTAAAALAEEVLRETP